MQYINLNKSIELENKIQDLLIINIDEKLDTIEDKEGVRINGKVTIGGTAKTLGGEEKFEDFLDLDIFLVYEEIEERSNLKINIKDFDYVIEDNKLNLEISISIDGLKEIDQTFLSKEDNEIFLEEKIEDDIKTVYLDEKVDLEDKEERISEEMYVSEKKEKLIQEEIIAENVKEEIITKKSLLKSVFSNKRIKEEVSWKVYCVKEEKSYQQIADKYNLNLEKLISMNKNEEIFVGKLIFLTLD